MVDYPEHNLAHMPGRDDEDDPIMMRDDLTRSEVESRLEEAVNLLNRMDPEDPETIDFVSDMEAEGWA